MEYEIIRIAMQSISDETWRATGRFIVSKRDDNGATDEVLDFELSAYVLGKHSYSDAETALKKRFTEFTADLKDAESI